MKLAEETGSKRGSQKAFNECLSGPGNQGHGASGESGCELNGGR